MKKLIWTRGSWWEACRKAHAKRHLKTQVKFIPPVVTACRLETIHIRLRLSKEIKIGGRVSIEVPIGFLLEKDVVLKGTRKGYGAAVSCIADSDAVPELTISADPVKLFRILDILITEFSLKMGELLEVVLGCPEERLIETPAISYPQYWEILVDRDGQGDFRCIDPVPSLNVQGNLADTFLVKCLPKQTKGKEVTAIVRPVCRANGLSPSGYFTGKAKWSSTDPGAQLPAETKWLNEHNPKSRMGRVVLNSEGFHTIGVFAANKGVCGISNPVEVNRNRPKEQIYFGEIHTHNRFCDGHGMPEDSFGWARDVAHLDFAAVTNHVEGKKRFTWNQKIWKKIKDATSKFNQDGKFVTLLGFEWGGWDRFGDKNVYYRNGEGDYYPANSPDSDTPEKLAKCLRGKQAIVIPHHTRMQGHTDWSWRNDRLQRLVEIYSCGWTGSEEGGPYSVQLALQMGHKLGFTGGTDNHLGQPGFINPDAARGGLTGVFASKLTRKSIFDALHKRRCYATTGVRMIIDFRINGHPMGAEFKENRRRRIYIKVAGTVELDKVEVLCNNKVIYSKRLSTQWGEWKFEDDQTIQGVTFYYLRVYQKDGHQGWSSPIWIKN